MEDEETGELFIPCRMCSLKCFRNHGKHHEKERFDGCVSFFKVMLGDFAQKLNIPPAFASRFINERDEHMVLQGPSGQEWDVQLWGTNNQLEFRDGWEKFVNYHGLQLGDFVVFKYISKLCFKVQIFETSGCVKNISALQLEKTNTGLDKKCPNHPKILIDLVSDEENNGTAEPAAKKRGRKRKSSFLDPIFIRRTGLDKKCPNHPKILIDLVSDEENNDTPEPAAKKRGRKRKSSFLGYSSKNHGHCFSSRKHMTMESPPFKSDKPFREMVMKSWNINNPHMLEFRKWGDYSIQLPNQKSEVVLLTGECKEWKVRCIIKNDAPTFSGGWRQFTRGNNIKEGDICIFEQLNNNQNKFMFRVHIFPHANKALQQKEEEKPARDEE